MARRGGRGPTLNLRRYRITTQVEAAIAYGRLPTLAVASARIGIMKDGTGSATCTLLRTRLAIDFGVERLGRIDAEKMRKAPAMPMILVLTFRYANNLALESALKCSTVSHLWHDGSSGTRPVAVADLQERLSRCSPGYGQRQDVDGPATVIVGPISMSAPRHSPWASTALPAT